MPYCPACSARVPDGAIACPTCGSPLITTPSATDADDQDQAPSLDVEALHDELAASLRPDYEILKLLGVGGMGAVFLAREPALRRLVAVKVLSPALAAEPRARSRFEREARAAAALSHPNVVRVYTVGETETRRLPYIIMQYVDGPTLAQRMARYPRSSERDARRIIGEVAAGLAAAHARDLVHRDVKPSNILIEADTRRAFVMDFGVSAALSPVDQATRLTLTGAVVGTPAYMSPEQAAGEPVTPKSDVYSLGLVAYELLTGALPYSATTAMSWAAAHLRDPATPVATSRRDLSPEIARVIDRCLAKDRAARPEARDVAATMLPSLESEIPWPPPGLAWLQGRGRVLARLSLFTAIGGLLTVFALAFTPRILQVHTYWLERFAPSAPARGARLAAFRGDPAAISQFVWQTVLIIGLAAFVTSLAALITVAIQTTRFALARRRRGWAWTTLADVAADTDGRSGLVLAGARAFASMDPASRGALLRARRLETAVEMGTGPWVALAAAIWTVAVVAGLISRDVTANLMGTAIWLNAALPVLGALIVSALTRYRERRLMTVLERRGDFEESDADVGAWYATAPAAGSPAPAPAPARLSDRLPVLAGQVLAVTTAATVVLALLAAALAALVAAVATSRLGPPAVELTAAVSAVDRADPIGTVRQLLATLLPLPEAGEPSVTGAALRMLLAPAHGEALPEYLPAPATLRDALREGVPAALRSGASARPGFAFRGVRLPPALSTSEALRRALTRSLPADTVRLLRYVGEHPRTARFRAATLAGHWDLPDPLTSLNRLGEAALANLLGAIGDVAVGDRAAARRRLSENAAAGLLLLRVPTLGADALGTSMLQSLALVPLAELEQLTGNARQAAEVREAEQRLGLLGLLSSNDLGGLAADPAHLDPVIAYLRDSRLPVGWRAALMADVIQGACTNPREVLLGRSAARETAILTAAGDMRDVPHAAELAAGVVDLWQGGTAGGVFDDRVAHLLGPAHGAPEPVGFLFRVVVCLVGT